MTVYIVVSDTTLDCMDEVQKVGRRANLRAKLSEETLMTVTNVTWSIEDEKSGYWTELKTCYEDCLSESLEMEYTTDRLLDSGVFEYKVEIYGDKEEYNSWCLVTLFVLGEF